MRLDDEDPKNGLQLVPGTYGQNFPSTCTIVIIAGKNLNLGLSFYLLQNMPTYSPFTKVSISTELTG